MIRGFVVRGSGGEKQAGAGVLTQRLHMGRFDGHGRGPPCTTYRCLTRRTARKTHPEGWGMDR